MIPRRSRPFSSLFSGTRLLTWAIAVTVACGAVGLSAPEFAIAGTAAAVAEAGPADRQVNRDGVPAAAHTPVARRVCHHNVCRGCPHKFCKDDCHSRFCKDDCDNKFGERDCDGKSRPDECDDKSDNDKFDKFDCDGKSRKDGCKVKCKEGPRGPQGPQGFPGPTRSIDSVWIPAPPLETGTTTPASALGGATFTAIVTGSGATWIRDSRNPSGTAWHLLQLAGYPGGVIAASVTGPVLPPVDFLPVPPGGWPGLQITLRTSSGVVATTVCSVFSPLAPGPLGNPPCSALQFISPPDQG